MSKAIRCLIGFFLCGLMGASAWSQTSTQLGVYYFPGWRDDAPAASSSQPWDSIKRFKDREPLLGWYDEGSDEVMRQHIDWMVGNGLTYVVFDWYWGIENRVFLDHALSAYMRAPNRSKLPFSIMWANHDKAPNKLSNWERMVDFWVRFYTPRPEMLRVDGKPVIFIFLARELDAKARKFGSSAKELLAIAQDKAHEAGLPGFYFVAGASSEETAVIKDAAQVGYSAVTMYNLHRPPYIQQESHSYQELDSAYRAHWKLYETVSSLPVIFPLTSGWDNRPWGGSKDPLHDESRSTPSEFESHLEAAKVAIEKGKLRKGQTTRWGLICCWNEFGEGSFIEPTRTLDKTMIDKVRWVFGSGKPAVSKE